MFELKVITRFSAAHQLRMVAKKCENLHGHNWKIEVFVTGNTLNENSAPFGGGIYNSEYAAPVIENTIIVAHDKLACGYQYHFDTRLFVNDYLWQASW